MKFKNTAAMFNRMLNKNNLTMQDLAKILGCHYQFVWNIAKGRAGVPASHVKFLSKFLPVWEFENAAIADFRAAWRREIKQK